MDDYARRLARGGYCPEDDSFEAQLIREEMQWEIGCAEHDIRKYKEWEKEKREAKNKKARERYQLKKQQKQQQQNGEQPSTALLAKKLNGGR